MRGKRETGTLRGAWYVTLIFFIFVVLHYADKFLVSPLLPLIRDEFKLGYTELGAIETGTILVAVAFMPLWGYLFDKYVRPPLVSLASAIWGCTTILPTFSVNYTQLILTRSVTGARARSSSVQDVALPEVRGSAMAMLLFFYNVWSAFAPLITGYAADTMGLEWGIVTIVNITWSICIVLLSMVAVFIPRDIDWKRKELAKRAETLASKQEGL